MYAELRIGRLLKVCRFVIRHITQTDTETETEANFTHSDNNSRQNYTEQNDGFWRKTKQILGFLLVLKLR